MKFKTVLAITGLVLAGNASADDLFLKLTGIAGDSADERHKNEIVIKSYSQAVSNTSGGSSGGSAAGRTVCGDIIVTKNLDPASPALIMQVLTGAVIQNGAIAFRRNGLPDYYTVALSGISVTSVEQMNSSTGGVTEVVKLKARQFMYTYQIQNPNGSPGTPVTFGFDCVSNARI